LIVWNRAQGILDTILRIQPKEGGSNKDGETREVVVYRLVEDMLSKMPKEFAEFEVREALNRMGPLLPMTIFLRQEIDRMQRVIKKVILFQDIFLLHPVLSGFISVGFLLLRVCQD